MLKIRGDAGNGDAKRVSAEGVVASVVSRLQSVATPERAAREKAYLKSDLAFLGASVPAIRRVATSLRQEYPGLSHHELFDLVERLWARRIHELRMAAVELLKLYDDRLAPADVRAIDRLIRESGTWALVDGLAASVTGALVDRFPDTLHPALARWAEDPDFWLRRASLLAYLPGLRRGEGHFDRFAALADSMLDEHEFFIRKAIGWVLREAGKKQPELVVSWLEPRIQRAAGLTVREALKYLPAADRRRLTAAREQAARDARG